LPIVVIRKKSSQLVLLMAEPFQLAGTRFGHAAHARAGIDPGDGALAARIPQKW